MGGRTAPKRKEAIEEDVVSQIFFKSFPGCQEIDYGEAGVSSIEEVMVIIQVRYNCGLG